MSRLTNPVLFFNDAIGRTLPEATLDFYDSGTFDRKDTYTDAALSSANPNPVVADGAGRFPDIFLATGPYRAVLSDENGVEIWTKDNIVSLASEDDVGGQAEIDVSGGMNITLTPGQSASAILVLTGTSIAPITIRTSNDNAKQYLVINEDDGGFDITLATATGTGVVFSQEGEQRNVRSDGTNMVNVSVQTRFNPFANEPIGRPFPIWDHITGADVPNNDGFEKYVKLTAGLTGAGQINEGLIGSESVSGSYPLVSATAVVTLANSPMVSGTLRLMNTEGRKLVAGTTSGVVRQDQAQAWQLGTEADATGSLDYWGAAGPRDRRAADEVQAGDTIARIRTAEQGDSKMLKAMNDGTNGDPRQGLENHDKDISATYWVRIR